MQQQIPISDLSSANIEAVNKADLVDASDFTLDNKIPLAQRAINMITTIKNPYCFRVGDIGVKLEFVDNAPPLQDVFTDFLKRQKSGL